MASRIIFLDIDGPMIPVRAWVYEKVTGKDDAFDPVAASFIRRLLDQTDTQLVISSTWRLHGKQCVEALLAANEIDPDRLHDDWRTPRLADQTRSDEIRDWLDRHPEIQHYVAIDDESLDIVKVPKATLCYTYDGMLWHNFLECCVYLDYYPCEDDRIKYPEYIKSFRNALFVNSFRYGDPKRVSAGLFVETLEQDVDE